MKIKHMFMAFCIGSTLIFSACKGKDGAIGPAGAVGPAGPTGAVGPVGPAGSANVKNFTFTTNVWVRETTAPATVDMPHQVLRLSLASLTDSIVNRGVVMAYIQAPDLNSWQALPYTQVITPTPSSSTSAHGYLRSVYFTHGIGNVVIRVMDSDGAPIAPAGTRLVRIVTIAPSNFKGDETGSQFLVRNNINLKDYNSVRAAFNLKD
jgi:hypothetical protein